jgi:uncharacterized coiled-coil protein SlyX
MVELPGQLLLQKGGSMRVMSHKVLVWLLLGLVVAAGQAQTSASSPSPSPFQAARDQSAALMEQRIEAISNMLAVTQQQLEQSQRQMQQLQQELLQLRQQMASAGLTTSSPAADTSASTAASANTASGESSSLAGAAQSSTSAGPAAAPNGAVPLEERLQTLEAAVKLHDQTKVESSSKYPVRVTGLILFNGFVNRGLTDNIDDPAIALRPTTTSGDGSLGASLRQTILGIEGDGPHVAGARTSANVNLDFFSGVSYTNYGTSSGVVRMRTASIDLDWANDSIQVGMVPPLISPLSPSSYATVAEPSLAGAGNLWTWAPQVRYAHRLPLRDGKHVQLELGLRDSPAAGYNPNQLFRTASPGERSKQPAYESRISYGGGGERGLQLGLGGYYSRQAYRYQGYPGTDNLDSWAVTTDFRVPLARYFEISGEGYRGRSLGGLGGGLYKDFIAGIDPVSGDSILRGLNAIGGWAQWKTTFSQSLESNLSIGLDDGFASDFHAVTLSPTASATQLLARNKMAVANLIFRPKTYLILSPEYRRIWTWPITGAANTADIFTLSVGYQF